MRKIIKYIVNNYSILLLIIMFVVASAHTICENDLYFDLKTGEDILKHGLTFKEPFSFIPGLTYVYLHWFYDIFIYIIYSIFSWSGLYIMFIFFSVLFFTVYYKETNKIVKDKLLSSIITLIVFYICKYAFVSRVQTIIYLILFIEVLLLEKLYKTGEKKYSIYLILLSILVVNLQMPIWIFYIILTLPYIFEALINKIFKDKFESCKNNKVFFITMGLIIISGLISPYGLIPYTYCLKSLGNPIYQSLGIGEMRATVLFRAKEVLAILLLYLGCLYLKIVKFTLRDFCLACGLFVFSLIVNKNVIFYLYFGPYILIKSLDLSTIKNHLNKIYCKINLTTIEIILIILCTILNIKVFNFKYKNFNNYGYDDYPSGIVNYLKENTEYKNIKLFTDYNNGSFYLFNDIKVFVDSRAEVYMKEYNGGQDILSDYIKLGDYYFYKDIIDKYEFDYFALSSRDDLVYYLLKEDGYCIVDSYREYVLFEHYNDKNIIR